MKIEIRKAKDLLPSNFEVVVDSVRWARLTKENMTTFRVQQEGSGRMLRHGMPSRGTGTPITLPTQAMYENRHRPDHGPLLTFDQRAEALIAELIKDGKLIHPVTAKAEKEAEDQARARRSAEIRDADQKKFEDRAREVLAEVLREALVKQAFDQREIDIVVAAMKDAQSW